MHAVLCALAGSQTTESEAKKGFKLPRSVMTNADVTRLINSDEVQSVVNAPKAGGAKHYALKKNPLKNLGAMLKLNPHAASARRCAHRRPAAAARPARAARARARAGSRSNRVAPCLLTPPPPTAAVCRNAILLSERRAKERAARLEKVRAGQPTGVVKRGAESKAVAKAFYKQMVVDSEYQGEDYEVFDKWLGTTQ